MEGEAETLTRRAVELAKEGNAVALRLCLSRVLPSRRERTVDVDLPAIKTLDDATAAVQRLIALAASGELTPSEAQSLAAMIEQQRLSIISDEVRKSRSR